MSSQDILISATADEVVAWSPYRSSWKIRVLVAGREHWTAADLIAACDHGKIPHAEVVRILLRPQLIPDRALWEIACKLVDLAHDRLRSLGGEPDPRSIAAIETRRRWLRGEATEDDLARAATGAMDAWWATQRDAAERWDTAARAAVDPKAWAEWDKARAAWMTAKVAWMVARGTAEQAAWTAAWETPDQAVVIHVIRDVLESTRK